jgi:hypothetical protein
MTGEDFRPSTGVGGQGIHCWRFRTIQAGESEIGMVLKRSWGAQMTGIGRYTFGLMPLHDGCGMVQAAGCVDLFLEKDSVDLSC